MNAEEMDRFIFKILREQKAYRDMDESEFLEVYEEVFGEPNRILTETLRYLDKIYNFDKLYYPGCGWHVYPREILGKERVVHLSIEKDVKGGYFKTLGEGLKVKGDYRRSPFKCQSFDATLLWGIYTQKALEAIPEFRRVTRHQGLLIFGSYQLCRVVNSHLIAECLDEQLKRINIPDIDPRMIIYQNEGL